MDIAVLCLLCDFVYVSYLLPSGELLRSNKVGGLKSDETDVKKNKTPLFFVLGIALLEGGNPIIQHSIFTKLQNGEISQAFLKVIYCYMLHTTRK